MLEIVSLSKTKVKNVSTLEATFKVDGGITPFRVSQEDRPDTYAKIIALLETPNANIEKLSEEIYEMMAPSAKVRKQIESSFSLSKSLSISDGQIYFGDSMLEEELSTHMLSLLDTDNVPKDEKLWKSYVKFLDNLYQNVNEDIRKQLFRWINYENQAGFGFGITEDGCIVGYKGCSGTVLNPVSVHSGEAIVNGVEMNGNIPNKIGSVVTMPRSAVQFDPNVGCSFGLHVGTRDYAASWAPILLLVKVNPRDVVSVPYECDSQKMRVCEYTVLEITDVSAEHKRYHSFPDVPAYDDSEDFVTLEDVENLLYREVYVEYDSGESNFEGVIVEVYKGRENGIIIKNEDDEYKHIKLNRINYLEVLSDDDGGDEDDSEVDDNFDDDFGFKVDIDESVSLLGSEVCVEYDGKTCEGLVVEVFHDGENSGLVLRTDDGHKHIKLRRITSAILLNNGEPVVPPVEDTTFAGVEIGDDVIVIFMTDDGVKSITGVVRKINDSRTKISIREPGKDKNTKVKAEDIVSVRF